MPSHEFASVIINYILEWDRLAEVTPALMVDDPHHARTLLDGRRHALTALTARIREALLRAYGVNSADDVDLGRRAAEQFMT